MPLAAAGGAEARGSGVSGGERGQSDGLAQRAGGAEQVYRGVAELPRDQAGRGASHAIGDVEESDEGPHRAAAIGGQHPFEGFHAECLRRWGLRGRTGGAWAKRTESGRLRWGTGYLLRSVCEPFILATIGGERDYDGAAAANLIETVAAAAVDGVAR